MEMNDLSKDDLLLAVSEGVKEAMLEMIPDRDSSKGFFEAIQKGLCDAVWRIATNASDMPCADFYESIKEGTKEGIQKFDSLNLERFPV